MLVKKQTPLIGEDLFTQIQGTIQKLNIKIEPAIIEKLGPLKSYYNSYLMVKNCFDKACEEFSETEKIYRSMSQIQDKITKLQSAIDADSNKITEIKSVFQSLESE